MSNRYIGVLPNNRFVTRGNTGQRNHRVLFTQDENEQLNYTVDLQAWLGSAETISSSTATASGVAVSNLTDNSTNVTFTVTGSSSCGEIDLLITTSAGQKKMVYMAFRDPVDFNSNDYVGAGA